MYNFEVMVWQKALEKNVDRSFESCALVLPFSLLSVFDSIFKRKFDSRSTFEDLFAVPNLLAVFAQFDREMVQVGIWRESNLLSHHATSFFSPRARGALEP